MDSIRKTLHNAQQGHQALQDLWTHAKAHLIAGRKLVVTLKPETRRESQNAHFHAQISDISKQLKGDLADPEDAKRILISAFKIDTREDPDLREEWAKFGDLRMGRGLRGEVVLMGTQSRDFSVKLAGAFIEWLYAFGAEAGVRFTAKEYA